MKQDRGRASRHAGQSRGLLSLALIPGLALAAGVACAEVKSAETGAFTIEHRLTLPGAPTRIYDAISGDLTPWWDHKFSESPKAFYIEPWPGGGFYEVFNESGDGALHATVTWAERGKRLRFAGPLGLAGNGMTFESTYDLEAKGDSTVVRFTGSAAGRVDEGWPELVDGVWAHFLFERLKPYVESGRDREKKPWPRRK